MRVRWGSQLSQSFRVSNGVRQGGIRNPQYIAETFNDYFARIGHKMAESISHPPQKLPISQLHTSSANSFFYISIIN